MKQISMPRVGLATLILVAGCGGSGNPASVEDFSPAPQSPEFRLISGTVAGLDGTVTLSWGGRSEALTGGDFSIPQAFEAGESFDLTLSDEPLGQRCSLTDPTTFMNQQDDVTGVDIACETLNLVRISVEHAVSGEPMADIPVTVTWEDEGSREFLDGESDADGQLTLEVPTFDGRIVVNADPADFAEQSKIVINTPIPAGRAVRLLMQPVALDTTFEAAAGANLSVNSNVLIAIPPNAMVEGSSGDPYDGTVAVELTVVDPSTEVEIMPGDYTSRGPGGATSPIQSYGAVSATFTGSGGEVLDLADGQTADLNVPVAEAERSGPPASVPLFHYDRLDGYWIEEGMATLTTLSSGLPVYAGQVSHFTTWNADQAYTPVFVDGCVVDGSGDPKGNVRVDATGASYIGATRAVTAADGSFSVPVRPQSDVLITVGDGFQSGTVEVSTGASGSTLTDCLVASAGSSTINLTWGENPSDLDTRLYGFSSADPGQDFEVNFTQRSATVDDITIDLDVDDVTSFGPEVVTFPDFPFPGVYRYAVHLFAGEGNIQSSPARVELNLRGQVSVFTPPEGQPTECWAVLDLQVDQSGAVSVQPLGTWEPETYCTSGDFSRPTVP